MSVCGDGELSTTNNFYVQFEYNCSLWKQNIVLSIIHNNKGQNSTEK
jgi:hypothetical protein